MADVDDVEGLLESDLTSVDIDQALVSSKVSSTGDGAESLVSPRPDDASSISGMLDESTDDPELEAIKARVREMEAEQLKLKQMQDDVEKQLMTAPGGGAPGAARAFPSQDEKMEADQRSIYVGNVDYSSTAEELEQHFNGCGAINRVTILCDKFTGNPKGFAYIEFSDKDSVETAQALNDSLFKGRTIKVVAKRFNVPGVSTTNRGFARGRGGRGMFRGGAGGFRPPFGGGGYRPYRGRGGGFRARRNWYSPY